MQDKLLQGVEVWIASSEYPNNNNLWDFQGSCVGWNSKIIEPPNMISPKVKQGRIKGEEGVERGFSLSHPQLFGALSLNQRESHPILSPPPCPHEKDETRGCWG